MSLADFWTQWATMAMLAIRHGDLRMFRFMIRLALAITLATLGALGISYHPRVA